MPRTHRQKCKRREGLVVAKYGIHCVNRIEDAFKAGLIAMGDGGFKKMRHTVGNE